MFLHGRGEKKERERGDRRRRAYRKVAMIQAGSQPPEGRLFPLCHHSRDNKLLLLRRAEGTAACGNLFTALTSRRFIEFHILQHEHSWLHTHSVYFSPSPTFYSMCKCFIGQFDAMLICVHVHTHTAHPFKCLD